MSIPHQVLRDPRQGPSYTPVWIWQRTWEFETLMEIYRQRAPRLVLEIGAYAGGTLWHLIRNAAPGATIISMDHYVNVEPERDNRRLYPEWQAARPDVNVEIWVEDSHSEDALALARQRAPFDWIFIDGDHVEAAVQADFENYIPLVAPGGVLGLHDILPAPTIENIQVEPVWRRVQRCGWVTQELVADPDAEWGGIGLVYP